MADEQVAAPVGDGVECDRCNKVWEEVLSTFRISLDRMKDIAAKGKGQEAEAETNMLYNRYMGCALAMDTLMKEYFPDKIKELQGAGAEEVAEGTVTEEAETADESVAN